VGMKKEISAVTALAGMLWFTAPGTALAQFDQSPRQVLIEPAFAYIGTELSAGIGMDWARVRGHYTSTGAQAPATGSESNTFGGFTFGATAWFSSGLGQPPAGSGMQIGRIDLGAGLAISPFFGGSNTPIQIRRHNDFDNDVTLERTTDYAIDLKVAARIPLHLGVSAPGTSRVTLAIEPEVGLALTHATTRFRSDQRFLNGTVEDRREGDVSAGLYWGLGLSAPIARAPFLGGQPLLGRVFYRGRDVGGSESTLHSVSGFTEHGRTEGYTNHQIGAELVIMLMPRLMR
jgi:hypothetical protein